MEQKFKSLADKLALHEQTAKDLRQELEHKRKFCQHVWGPVRYTPYIIEAYLEKGDPPGVGGSDHRFDNYVPRQETPIWTRTCEICGKEEQTYRIKEEVKKSPDWS